jgi:alpha-beta hydrolase superfamily lysophospholipase
MTEEFRVSTFISSDGDNVVVQDWPLAPGKAVRGVVVIVHGLGEHIARYAHVARQLNQWGFFVRGYDQCGHGDSGGAHGTLPTDTRLLDDLADIVDDLRAHMEEGLPLILLGHSMGGLVVARFVSLNKRPVEALVLSSPALDPGLSALQKLLLAVLPKYFPDLRVSNGVKPQYISRDPEVVKAYREDRRVHDRISGRLARFIALAGPATLARAAHWKVPTLLMYAGSDRVLNPAGSRAFAKAAPASVVTSVCFEEMYHEIFNEPDSDKVFAALKSWLDQRF